MKKSSRILGTIGEIEKTPFVFAHQQTYNELFKSKVKPNEKIMVAVSGGADSILTACLMYNFFLKEKYNLQNLFFIHCNHKTRPGNKNDEKFINTFFEKTQLIVTKRTSKKKATESELRTRRYSEFKKHIQKKNIDQIIFGHNLTDRIESTFLNLLRGANLNGFLAMQTQENHHLLPGTKVFRPLLGLSKDEITAMCKQNKIPFIIDPTNIDSTTSLRNKLRNKVLPTLYELAHKQTATTNSFIGSMKQIYAQLENISQQHIILEPIYQSPHRNAKFAYQRMIDPKDITSEWMMQAMKILDISNNITTPLLKERTTFLQKNESGYKYFNTTYLFKSHRNIYFISAPKFFWQKTIEKAKKITKLGNIDREGGKHEIDKKEYLWAMLIFPKKGDLYRKKTRNEYCINQKIPIFRRNFIPIVVKWNQIIKIFKT